MEYLIQTNCDLWQTWSMCDFFPNVPLALLWWCKGAVTPVLQGAAQPPALPLLSRLLLSLCAVCYAAWIHSARSKMEKRDYVWVCMSPSQLPTASCGHCSRVRVCVCVSGWALGFCGQHSPATHVAEVGPSQRSTFTSSSLSDPLAGSTSPCSRLSEHVF